MGRAKIVGGGLSDYVSTRRVGQHRKQGWTDCFCCYFVGVEYFFFSSLSYFIVSSALESSVDLGLEWGVWIEV